MDKLTAMSVFAEVAKTDSFADASRRLGMSRSQVNKLVIALEDDLGVTLFNRTTRKVTLTATGKAYLERVKHILADVSETESLVKDNQETPSGELKINAPMSFGTMHLSHAVIDFMKRYPQIRVELVLSDEKINPVSNGFDMTVRIASPSESMALIEHTIVEVRRVICASNAFLASYELPLTLDCLKQSPCLHYGNLPSGNNWKLTGPDGEKSIRVNGVLCSNNAEVLRDACAAGMGFALLPSFIANEALKNGQLVQVLEQYHAPELQLSLLYPPNRHLSTRIALFVKFMQERFGEPY